MNFLLGSEAQQMSLRLVPHAFFVYAIQPISLALSLAALHAKARNCGKLILRFSSGTLDAEKELAMSLLSSDLV